jgi:hypothetical protein
MEVESDALIAARRMVAAMSEVDDEATRYSMWRAAVKYMLRAKREALVAAFDFPEDFGASDVVGEETRHSLLAARTDGVGSLSAGEW